MHNSTVTPNPGLENYQGHFTNQPQSVCPHCGYCPHCGRGGYRTYPYPWQTPVWCGDVVTTTLGTAENITSSL